jgi:cell division protein FtsL
MTATTTDPRTRRHAAPTRRETRAPRHTYATSGAAAMAVAPAAQTHPAPAPRPRPAERPNHLRVVAPSERVRRRLTPGMAVLLTAALFATLLAVAVAHTVLVEGQVRLDQLDRQLVDEQARYQELRTEVAQLESPERIVQSANEMGMVTPDDLQYLQPPAPDASTVGPTTGDDDEPAADPTVGAEPDRPWADVKPLLEAPAP